MWLDSWGVLCVVYPLSMCTLCRSRRWRPRRESTAVLSNCNSPAIHAYLALKEYAATLKHSLDGHVQALCGVGKGVSLRRARQGQASTALPFSPTTRTRQTLSASCSPHNPYIHTHSVAKTHVPCLMAALAKTPLFLIASFPASPSSTLPQARRTRRHRLIAAKPKMAGPADDSVRAADELGRVGLER